ncbi:ATP-dependent HslUV protease ATP-binding subunit HslU [Candidatus Kinetoplastibacterium oncopeltii TCC290E]|uniref:ATP-dependent protease ATPase subunit HslU n=1 Tax=Candidatus Kinetoplastidibacterium stringomonadis TCC290E TaxID=1208920 RepID=M1L7U9_9PROT|nr:ATP-dependent protease ATPase subunit HslU [Candidatus Kinetoplastibacterium oncopeltii]AGF48658.1 ATP-dependent HslUV protease ATP-binding subunit HslU [Candidatus Kinetoplastibacterium oncopeltii TCC290E]
MSASSMTPREIVLELDKYIVGQNRAKKSVAIALRNRWRRQQVPEGLRQEIYPKNILMIGPTGVGKTEIARRLAKLVNAPFIKIEATKFTEVGYVGRDVDTIIRDLVEYSIKQTREIEISLIKSQAEESAEKRILDIIIPNARNLDEESDQSNENNTRQTFRKRLREGRLDNLEIEIEVNFASPQLDIMTPPGMEEIAEQLKTVFAGISSEKKKTKKVKIKEAFKIFIEEESSKRINEDEIKFNAIRNVEQNGIVFLDEIDKIATRNRSDNAEVSRLGVQRDLLPLVEGTSVNTRYGIVKTDHILFIASGAFHLSRPSDLIPELQGRFPIRVELNSLSIEDFSHILSDTNVSLTKQYSALLETENVKLDFQNSGITKIAELAYSVNERTEDIGARRLYTLMEKLLEELSFDTSNANGKTIIIDAMYVEHQLKEIVLNQDLSRYIL